MRGSNISNKFSLFFSYSADRAQGSFLIFYYVYEIGLKLHSPTSCLLSRYAANTSCKFQTYKFTLSWSVL